MGVKDAVQRCNGFVLGLRSETAKCLFFLISGSISEHSCSMKRSLPNIGKRVLSAQFLFTPTLKPMVGAKMYFQTALYHCRGKNHACSRSRV